MTDLIRAYTLPERYAVEIPIDRVVCDDKVDNGWVEHLENSVDDPKEFKAIVVVKHPKKEIYAVLDGHHRFWILKRSGASSIRASVVDDYIGLGFYLTSKGTFQPHAEITKYVRVPLKRFIKFMEEFLRSPEEVLRHQLRLK